MKVVVPSSWSELSDFQQREIINIINGVKSKNFTEAYIKIIQTRCAF
ncbi:hypothetical protein [Riemerella anatipestifer]|nr:hypothetical protein [Riemerella anatipestifer]MBT0572319.1 hypothetical protein [Riemerella anatipestifer]MDR7797966.1 hypothetical protein [Riemerella anatipestifer]MDY3391897.1 hypothetical protein [Riemerella anatipestifer]MDY3402920.1 hypothetical protein [Riemerella anatipestifer]MDY3434291.1 hypothetical protein [Riemerella anatipestifer]